MPCELAPCDDSVPVLLTVTVPPGVVELPLPPSDTSPPELPPSPPLPPTLCAKITMESVAVVVIAPLLVTETAPPLPPLEPLPPSETRPPELPPPPPPPPMLWAKMPYALAPPVVIEPALFTVTWPPSPALAPLLPNATMP